VLSISDLAIALRRCANAPCTNRRSSGGGAAATLRMPIRTESTLGTGKNTEREIDRSTRTSQANWQSTLGTP